MNKDQLTIREVRDARIKLELHLSNCIQAVLKEFNEYYGIGIDSISVSMLDVTCNDDRKKVTEFGGVNVKLRLDI